MKEVNAHFRLEGMVLVVEIFFYMEWRNPGLVGFCFHALGDTKQKKPTTLDRGPPLHVNRVLLSKSLMEMIHSSVNSQEPIPILYKEKSFQFIKLKSV